MSDLQSSSAAMQAILPFEEFLESMSSPLHIPPLISMFPSAKNDRLAPLEEAPKLSGRQMALARAKILDEPEASELAAIVSLNAGGNSSPTINPLDEHNKKKRKLARHEQLADFVHLPKPKPKFEDVNRRPFRPIAVLNQLNEPPPSAALFPPITPNQEEREHSGTVEGSGNGSLSSPQEGCQKEHDSERKDSNSSKTKRNYTRTRRKWTEAETECLKKGVAICGVGRWKDILEHPNLEFQEGRTHVDLKDRFRTLYPPKQPEKWVGKVAAREEPQTVTSTLISASTERQRAPYRGWSEKEDAELDKGFKVYGYQWYLIAQDKDLQFDARSANQIRDRFRRRFPDLYAEQAPVSIREKITRTKDRDKSEALRDDIGKTSGISQRMDDHTHLSNSDNEVEDDHGFDPERIGPKGAAPPFLSALLNGDEEETDFSNPLDALDDLTLPPLQWDDMAVQPMFDLG